MITVEVLIPPIIAIGPEGTPFFINIYISDIPIPFADSIIAGSYMLSHLPQITFPKVFMGTNSTFLFVAASLDYTAPTLCGNCNVLKLLQEYAIRIEEVEKTMAEQAEIIKA
ncbi:MAG: hypothetical protein ACE5PM_06455 [Candidatus Hydrothermarchaeales archaeon]